MNFRGHNYSSSTCVTFQSLQMSHLLLLAKVAADSQWLKWGQKLITYPENCHNKSWFPSHCPFSSNLLHGQILQKISVQQSGSKDAGFEGGLFQKVFKGYIFCFLGHSVGAKNIWRICPWNKFEEKAQCAPVSPQFCANPVNRMTIYIVVRQWWSSQRPAEKHAVMGLRLFFQKKDTTCSGISSPKLTLCRARSTANLVFLLEICRERGEGVDTPSLTDHMV